MRNLYRSLMVGGCSLLAGCSASESGDFNHDMDYNSLEGRVVSDKYTAPIILQDKEGNPVSVSEKTFSFVLETNQGPYTFSVKQNPYSIDSPTLESLDLAIEPGRTVAVEGRKIGKTKPGSFISISSNNIRVLDNN